jgi:hypothetical protein
MTEEKNCRKFQFHFRNDVAALFMILGIVFFFSNSALGSEGRTGDVSGGRFFTEMGVMAGYGSGNIPEGSYQPLLLIGHFGVDLKRYFSGLRNHEGTLSAFIEPQVNPVFEPSANYEAGLGVGLQYSYPVGESVSLYISGSTGPHYISVVTQKQANGFLFSNNIGTGVYYHLSKDSALHVGYRFRHMSNAGLATPNGGIDTHMGVIGYSLFFK